MKFIINASNIPYYFEQVCVAYVSSYLPLCVCVCVCVRARARLRPFTVKASSVWNSWITREQINNVTVKMFISYAKFLHRYFGMQHLAFQTIHFILFTH